MIINKEQDIQFMKQIATQLFASTVFNDYGDEGLKALTEIVEAASTIYKYIDLKDTNNIVFYKTFDNSKSLRSIHSSKVCTITDFSSFASHQSSEFVVELINNNEVVVLFDDSIDVNAFTANSVVYHFNRGNEIVHGITEQIVLTRPPDVASYFAFPTYKTLDAALERYKIVRALRSQCPILSASWFDQNRIFFGASPEAIMRKSLHSFLSETIRAEVREEQVVNDSEPVDIKVTWNFSSHIALIEIKWIGKSLDVLGRSSFNQAHYDARANAGARQLADYLDQNKAYTPQNVTVGYLVVFDARRRGTNTKTVSINRSNGFYYQNLEIDYVPDYHSTRDDFARPVRIFIEPITTA